MKYVDSLKIPEKKTNILDILCALNPRLDPWPTSASKFCLVFNLSSFIAYCCHTVELAGTWYQRSASKLTWATDCILKTQQRAQSSILVWRSKLRVGGWGTSSFFASVIYNVLLQKLAFYTCLCVKNPLDTWFLTDIFAVYILMNFLIWLKLAAGLYWQRGGRPC